MYEVMAGLAAGTILLWRAMTLFAPKPKPPEPEAGCNITDKHRFEPRYDEAPLVTFGADDLIKIEQSNAQTILATPTGKGMTTVITESNMKAVLEASRKKTHLYDLCVQCGKVVKP